MNFTVLGCCRSLFVSPAENEFAVSIQFPGDSSVFLKLLLPWLRSQWVRGCANWTSLRLPGRFFLVSVDADQRGTGVWGSECSLDTHSLSSPGPVIWECSDTGDWYQYSNTTSVTGVTEVLKFFVRLILYWQKEPLTSVCLWRLLNYCVKLSITIRPCTYGVWQLPIVAIGPHEAKHRTQCRKRRSHLKMQSKHLESWKGKWSTRGPVYSVA